MSNRVTEYCTDVVKLYAKAFFDYAVSQDIIIEAAKEVTKFQSSILQNPILIQTISAPIYSEQEQHQLLLKLVQTLHLSKEIANLLDILAKNKRLNLLIDIFKNFNLLLSEYSGNKIVEVIVSQKLLAKEQNEIKKHLEEILSSKIELFFKIEPKILGGMIIKVDNKMLDASLRSKFAYLTNAVKKKIALL